MWAVIGVWRIDADAIGDLRERIPLMAAGKIDLPGFLHGTWTRDGHMIQVYADEQSAKNYHQDMINRHLVEPPGVRNLVWEVAEVGAESDTTGWTDRDGRRHDPT